MKRLQRKVAIVTGGGTGIGEATAVLFAKEGAEVVVNDVNMEAGERTVKRIIDADGGAIFTYGDVSKPKDIENVVKTAVRTYGRLNILVNNAGYLTMAKCADTPLEEWEKGIAVDLTGVFLGCKYAIPEMLKAGGGSIVNISSCSGLYGEYKLCWYTAAKGGVSNLTRSVAVDYAREGIRCNAVCPALTLTEMTKPHFAKDPRIKSAIGVNFPMGRPATPREIAFVALFLASDESSIVNGVNLLADGGLTAHSGQPDYGYMDEYLSRKYIAPPEDS
jgi:meso-butanediol dehydrogenase/(S,S)-butanediol dehydrogenase/diacetyl reductase